MQEIRELRTLIASAALLSIETEAQVTSPLILDRILEGYESCISLHHSLSNDEQKEFTLLGKQIRDLTSAKADQAKIRKVVGHFFHFRELEVKPLWLTDEQVATSSFLTGYVNFPSTDSTFLELNTSLIPGNDYPNCLSKVWMFLQGTYEPSNDESTLALLSLHFAASFLGIDTLLSLTIDLIENRLSSLEEGEASALVEDKEIQAILYSQIEAIEDIEKKERLLKLIHSNAKTAFLVGLFLLDTSSQWRGKLFEIIRTSNAVDDAIFLYQFLCEFNSSFPLQINRNNINFYLDLERIESSKTLHPIALTLCTPQDISAFPDFMKTRVVSLSFRYEFEVFELANLLQVIPNLEILDLSCCKLLQAPFSDDILLKMSNLRWFIPPQRIDAINLISMLRAAPRWAQNIKHLNLSHCEGIYGEWPADTPLHLPNLSRFSIPKVISASKLANMLATFPQIECLDLSASKQLTEEWPESALINLPNLKQVRLPKAINTSIFIGVLLAAPQYTQALEHLDLSPCRGAKDAWTKNSRLQFPRVKRLSPPTGVEISCLIRILSAIPHVEHLDLSSCTNIWGTWPQEAQLHLFNLRRLSCCEETHFLFNFLAIAPNLERLDLSSCKVTWGRRSDNPPLQLPRLRQFSPPKAIFASDLARIFVAASEYTQNLECLDLSSCDVIQGEVPGNIKLSFPALTHFSPPKEWSVFTLITFFSAALQYTQTLEHLDLSTCKRLEQIWPKDTLLPLPNLKRISFPQIVNAQTIVRMIANAPNLEHLDFSFCQKIIGECAEHTPLTPASLRTITVNPNTSSDIQQFCQRLQQTTEHCSIAKLSF